VRKPASILHFPCIGGIFQQPLEMVAGTSSLAIKKLRSLGPLHRRRRAGRGHVLLGVDQEAKWAERSDRKDLVCHQVIRNEWELG